MSRRALLRRGGLALLLALAFAAPARAGTFVLAGEANGLDVIAHPVGYTGAGGVLTVSVCIDPTSAHAAAMVVPTQNIIHTWNALVPTTPNLVFGTVGGGNTDWESVALHELGHCGFALAHPNLASESGLSGNDTNYTKSTDGPNNVFDRASGDDTVIGSSDDVRGDDVNLHWFRIANNNPFTIEPTVDATTYARDTALLPVGHLFAANADFAVGALLGFPDTEAVMQQGSFTNEAQRTLNHDDVATALLGETGLDELAGTADDYTVSFVYAGLTAACNVVLDFDNTQTSFAACSANLSTVAGDHWRIDTGRMVFNTSANWFFNPVPNGPTATSTPTATATPTVTPTPMIDHYVLYKAKASTRIDLPNKGKFPPKDYNLTLDDVTLANTAADDPENYQVKRERSLGVPAVKNAGTPLFAPALHYVRYQLKEAHEGVGAFDPGTQSYPRAVKHVRRSWLLLNQFGTIQVQTKKVEGMLVPAAKDLAVPPAAPADATHYICYQAKATKLVTAQTPDAGGGTGKFRRDLDAYFTDQFLATDCALDRDGNPTFPGSPVAGTCLFNLRKPTALCNPVIKSDVGGAPPRTTLAPPGSTSTPTSSESLLCYQVKLSSRVLGASAAALGNVGVGTLLKQQRHVKRLLAAGTAPHTTPGNQFPAPLQMDTTKAELACVPTFVLSAAPVP